MRSDGDSERSFSMLPNLPRTWQTLRLRRLLTSVINGTTAEQLERREIDSVPVTRIESISHGYINWERVGWARPSSVLGRYRMVAGDILFSHINSLSIIGNVAYYGGDRDLYVGVNLLRLRPSKEVSARFLFWMFRSSFFRQQVESHAKPAINQASINTGTLSALICRVPHVSEQTRIANFLDRETAEADVLIAKYERLLELLEERRIALITNAVTKGLDSAAPTKDSGIEWLGEVPAHWHIIPLKYLVDVTSGSTPSKDRPEYWNGNLPWASAKDLKSDSIADTEDHVSELAAAECGLKIIPASSILTVVRGMILARYLPVTITERPMTINQDLKALRVRKHVEVSYLANFLRSKSSTIIALADTAAHGTKVLRSEDWLNLPVPVPPRSEQVAIIARVVRESSSLNNARAQVSDAITLAKEHRAALITAAVTGQIDVTTYRSKTKPLEISA